MLRTYGVEKFYNRLEDLDQNYINRGASTYGLSLIIGGGESSLWDIPKAYLSMARDLKSYNLSSSQYVSRISEGLSYILDEQKSDQTKTTVLFI